MSQIIDTARVYSERQGLKWLLQGLDSSELLLSVPNRAELAKTGNTSESNAPAPSMLTLCAKAIAAQSVSKPVLEREERLFGDLTASGHGTTAERGIPSLMSEICGALAQHYSSLVTGSGGCAAAGAVLSHGRQTKSRGGGVDIAATVRDSVTVCLGIARTWCTTAAAFWQQSGTRRCPDGVAAAFLSALFDVKKKIEKEKLEKNVEEEKEKETEKEEEASPGNRESVEIAHLFAKGHLPHLSLRDWHCLLEVGRQACRLNGNEGLTKSGGRLSWEMITARCLMAVLCEGAVAPALRGLSTCTDNSTGTDRIATTRGDAFRPPPRVMKELIANAQIIREIGGDNLTEALRCRLAIVFADSFFLQLLKPFPSLIATFMLTAK